MNPIRFAIAPLLGVGCFFLAAESLAQPPGLIACVLGEEHRSRQVVVIDPASGELREIGPGTGDGAPRWSPDGRFLAFETDAPDGRAIYVADVHSGEGRVLDGQFAWNRFPRWSPEGDALVYAATNEDGMGLRPVVLDLESGEETIWGGAIGLDSHDKTLGLTRPVWLPRLRLPRQAGEGFATSYALLLAIDPSIELKWEGVDVLQLMAEAESAGALIAIGLVPGPAGLSTEILFVTETQRIPILPLVPGQVQSYRYAEWGVEPDRSGASLAYESNDGGDREIFVLNRRGISDVSNHRAADWNPQWDDSGNWLLGESFRSGRRAIYTFFPNTARVEEVIVSEDADNWGGAWAPGGEWITFVSDRSGTPAVYVATRRGEDIRQISPENDKRFALAPQWQPEFRE